MARWLRTFMILSVVAILNIIGFMYMSGYSFIIWGSPVDLKKAHEAVNIGNDLPRNEIVNDFLRKPLPGKEEEKPPQNKDEKKSEKDINNSNNTQEQEKNEISKENVDNEKPVNDGDDGETGNELVIVKDPQDKEQDQVKPASDKENISGGKKSDVQAEVDDKLEKMKVEMEAHQKEVEKQTISQGTHKQENKESGDGNHGDQVNMRQGQQNINPAVGSKVQMVGPHPDPHLKNIAPGILRDIVSKAKPPNTQKVFPHDFNLDLNEPTTCENEDGSHKDVFLLVLVNSIHKNFEQRRAIRSTWGSIKSVEGKRVLTMFTLAKNSDKNLNEVVRQESEQYQDILMEDFIDTYKNLTYKTIMALKYAAMYCPQADYVMKTDDDMWINYNTLVKYLASPHTPSKNHVAGFVINGAPIRDPKSKWYMPRNLYPGNKYPPFCSGTGYVMSGDVALKVYAISEYTPFLYLEDVFVAICLEKLHIVPLKQREFNNWRTSYSYCRFKHIITTHMVTPTEMNRIWKDQNSKKGYRC